MPRISNDGPDGIPVRGRDVRDCFDQLVGAPGHPDLLQSIPVSSVVRLYEPWRSPVLAGRYTDLAVLRALHTWVLTLHHRKQIIPQVTFTLENIEAPVGVLFDPDEVLNRWTILRLGWYLVFADGKLSVLDEIRFHTTYCDSEYSYQGGHRAAWR